VASSECAQIASVRPSSSTVSGGTSRSMSASMMSIEWSQRSSTSSPFAVTLARRTRPWLGSGRRRTSRRFSNFEMTTFMACGVTNAQRANWAHDIPSRWRSTLSVTYSVVVTPCSPTASSRRARNRRSTR
jgi:hypothetical protein